MLANPTGTSKQDENNTSGKSQVSPPSLSLPKGGGAIRGIGEKFAANPVTGTGSMSVPIFTSRRAVLGRSFPFPTIRAPATGHSASVGASLSVDHPQDRQGPAPVRDAEDSDEFLLSGAEDLVPVLVPDGDQWVREDPPPRASTASSTASTVTGRESRACSPGSNAGPISRIRGHLLALHLQGQHHHLVRQDDGQPDRRPGRPQPHLQLADLRELRRQGQRHRLRYKPEDSEAWISPRPTSATAATRAARRTATSNTSPTATARPISRT